MKKNILLTLVSLVIFAGSAWGNYKFSYPKEVTLASAIGDSKSISLGGTANITAFACSLKTENKYTSKNMLIGSTKGGSDLYNGNPGGGSSTSYIYHSTEVSCSTATIYFEHPVFCAKRTCKNMVFTIATATPSIADAILFSTTTCTFNVFSGTAISTDNFTSTDTNFAVTAVSLVTDYCYSVTLSFSPTTVGSYSSTIKLNGEDAATVSAKGLLPAPTVALDATDVTFNSFTANWKASDLEGAKYNVDVYDAEGTNIASASNIEENYFEVSNLDPESTYTYVAYVVVGEATSEASNTISVTTLPLTPTVALDATDVTFNSFTANWEASDLEGATYSIDVKNATDITIASASNLEETSYTVSNLDPESDYTYVVYVVVGEATSEASNAIEVTTLAKPTIMLDSEELYISTDTDIEQMETIPVSTINVKEVTATIAGDAGFYFEGGELTKTIPVNEDGSVEFNLLYKFTEEGDFNGTITFSATDAEDAYLSLYASASKPTDVPESTISGIVKSFNNGLLLLNGNYANIVVSNLAGKTVAEAKGNSVNVAAGYLYIVKTVDFEGNVNSFRVQ